MIKKRFLSIFSFVAVLCALALSTYGWRFCRVMYTSHGRQDENIAKALKDHVYVLSHEIGWRTIEQYDNLKKAAQYIIDNFQQAGLGYQVQVFTVNGKKVGNIVAEKKGLVSPEKIIIVGANYDTYFNPGSDTNASGIAVLLELAKTFAQMPTEYTLRFVAFAMTEPPFFGTEQMGSLQYVRHLQQKKENVEGVIILNSVGYFNLDNYSQRYPPPWGALLPDKGHFLAIVGNFKSWNFLGKVSRIFREKSSLPTFSVIGFDFLDSDYWSFREGNYPVILFTDTGPYRNNFYRGLLDNYQELDYLSMAKLTSGLNIALNRLANPSIKEKP